jgi:hypothetical protein
MRWWTTAGALARREAILVAGLGAGAAIVALGVSLGATWLSVVGLAIAVGGALARMGIAAQRARTESTREHTESQRLLRVPVASVAEVDPLGIGVDRAEQTILPGEGTPMYVVRNADARLRDAIAAGLAGSGPWIVVVQGPSKVGKSRSVFEALRTCSRDAPLNLVAPVNGDALKALLTPGVGLRTGLGAAVLWLDDLEPFLNSGVTLQTLREWHAGRTGRIVAATYGGKGSDLVVGSPTAGLATIANEVLQHAREIPLENTTAAELGGLLGAVSGPEARELDRHGLAAYVVAGPALERKLNTGAEPVKHFETSDQFFF